MRISSNPTVFERSVSSEMPAIDIGHRRTAFETNKMHSHSYCELTVYTECRKSVFAGDSIYITPGACAFTFRPGEVHCGIHHKGDLHERYVISFAPDCFDLLPDGRRLLRCFFERREGEHNMIVMPEAETAEGFALLDGVFDAERRALPELNAVIFANMIKYLSLLNRFYLDDRGSQPDTLPQTLNEIVAYIGDNLPQQMTVTGLSASFGISVSTLERLFRDTFDMTPGRFIFLRRIENAKKLLRRGSTVTRACFDAGFGDYSHFIADFRRETGVTPAEYGKIVRGKT